ncbi:N-acetyltransferase [Duganella rhizosphaerae]|uniref:GNAT family N-acetyltransferase n=1 Tax=Duganella rhizosphaerae TaxID=2885763 RepID=UPI0030E8A10D
MSAHIVKLEEAPDGGDMQELVKGLTAYNAAQANGETPNYLVATVKDDGGKLVGGLLGATYLGWLQIQVVWLDDSVRGLGYGSELMAIAEREGLRRGVQKAFVETLSFQALPFYEKLGYTVFSRLADFPPGGARYALTKKLAA